VGRNGTTLIGKGLVGDVDGRKLFVREYCGRHQCCGSCKGGVYSPEGGPFARKGEWGGIKELFAWRGGLSCSAWGAFGRNHQRQGRLHGQSLNKSAGGKKEKSRPEGIEGGKTTVSATGEVGYPEGGRPDRRGGRVRFCRHRFSEKGQTAFGEGGRNPRVKKRLASSAWRRPASLDWAEVHRVISTHDVERAIMPLPRGNIRKRRQGNFTQKKGQKGGVGRKGTITWRAEKKKDVFLSSKEKSSQEKRSPFISTEKGTSPIATAPGK